MLKLLRLIRARRARAHVLGSAVPPPHTSTRRVNEGKVYMIIRNPYYKTKEETCQPD